MLRRDKGQPGITPYGCQKLPNDYLPDEFLPSGGHKSALSIFGTKSQRSFYTILSLERPIAHDQRLSLHPRTA